jgi:hypothetical protein
MKETKRYRPFLNFDQNLKVTNRQKQGNTKTVSFALHLI